MSKALLIDGKEYTLRYGGEAAFDDEFLASISVFFGEIALAENENNILQMIKGMAQIPKTVLIMFYSGLKENHGTGLTGDKTVPDKEKAKSLLMTYIKDHKSNFSAVLNMCVQQMQKDGFLQLIGLDGMLENENEPVVSEIK